MHASCQWFGGSTEQQDRQTEAVRQDYLWQTEVGLDAVEEHCTLPSINTDSTIQRAWGERHRDPAATHVWTSPTAVQRETMRDCVYDWITCWAGNQTGWFSLCLVWLMTSLARFGKEWLVWISYFQWIDWYDSQTHVISLSDNIQLTEPWFITLSIKIHIQKIII